MVGDFIVTDQPLYVNKQDKAHKIDGGFLADFNFRLMSEIKKRLRRGAAVLTCIDYRLIDNGKVD